MVSAVECGYSEWYSEYRDLQERVRSASIDAQRVTSSKRHLAAIVRLAVIVNAVCL